MLAGKMLQAKLPVNGGPQHVFRAFQPHARPGQQAVRRAPCERRNTWRIQAFGGLFGGGKKDAGGTKAKPCKKCKSTGSLTCPGCKGSGRNKKNGNVFERWKCYDCQGFGQISCPACGGKGLTPEQRGER